VRELNLSGNRIAARGLAALLGMTLDNLMKSGLLFGKDIEPPGETTMTELIRATRFKRRLASRR
jgi:hypothetical protein